MVELFLHTANLPFSLSIILMFCITIIEGAGSFLGFGISEYLDNVVPDFDVDLELDAPDAGGVFSRLLGWIRVKKVPVLILVVFFLTMFGLVGLSIQSLSFSFLGIYLPAWIASCVALVLSLPMVRGFGGLFGRLFPRDETEAVSERSYIGKVAHITLGTAFEGNPAEAKFRDQFGTTHYIMVEPDDTGDVFEQGDGVLIVNQHGAVFSAIKSALDT